MTPIEAVEQLRQTWLARAKSTHLEGDERDSACLNFLCGAIAVLPEDDELANKLSLKAFLVSVRGASMFEKEPA